MYAGKTDLLHARHIAWPRAKADAVEHVRDHPGVRLRRNAVFWACSRPPDSVKPGPGPLARRSAPREGGPRGKAGIGRLSCAS